MDLCTRCGTFMDGSDYDPRHWEPSFDGTQTTHLSEALCVSRINHPEERLCECGHSKNVHNASQDGTWIHCRYCSPKDHNMVYDDDEKWPQYQELADGNHWYCLTCVDDGCETQYHTGGHTALGADGLYCLCDHAGPVQDIWAEGLHGLKEEVK